MPYACGRSPRWPILLIAVAGCVGPGGTRPDETLRDQVHDYAAVRFTPAGVPTIDGDLGDWGHVPPRYWIGTDRMALGRPRAGRDDLQVCVGYCAETGRVYFAVRVTDDYLRADRQQPDDENYYPFHDDVFEVVIDADTSGGDFVHFKQKTRDENRRLCGCHAQNYHVYLVSPPGPAHAWVWGDQKWLLGPPYAAFADRHQGQTHGPATVTLEFYVTPFNYAGTAGPHVSAPAPLVPGQKIGVGWLRLDEDGPDEAHRRPGDEYYFGRHRRLYRNADHCFEITLDPAPCRRPCGCGPLPSAPPVP